MKKYPKIPSFRNVIKSVRAQHDYIGDDESGQPIYEHTTAYPVMMFVGTVKVHGKNGSIHFDGSVLTVCSRTSRLTEHDDNHGFHRFVSGISEDALRILRKYDAVFGEWCGKGINKGCGIHQLEEKRFIVFDARMNDMWVQPNFTPKEISALNGCGVFVMNMNFPAYLIDVDFNVPEMAAGKIAELVNKVEAECPVAKAFGVPGAVGEGIVWHAAHDLSSKYWFKTKGTKHVVMKTKTLVPVDVEKVKSVKAFVGATVTTKRLEQGLAVIAEQGKQIVPEETGTFLKWVVNDILTEEADTMKENVLAKSDVTRALSAAALAFWFNMMTKQPL